MSRIDEPGTATQSAADERELAALRADYPGWRIWRAVRNGERGPEPGSWMASLHDPAVGVDPTLMEPTADQLRAALDGQRRRVARGERRIALPTGDLRYGGGR